MPQNGPPAADEHAELERAHRNLVRAHRSMGATLRLLRDGPPVGEPQPPRDAGAPDPHR